MLQSLVFLPGTQGATISKKKEERESKRARGVKADKRKQEGAKENKRKREKAKENKKKREKARKSKAEWQRAREIGRSKKERWTGRDDARQAMRER